MPLSTQDLADLKARVQYAQHHGFAIAKAADYVALLGGGEPAEGIEAGSTAHLLALLGGDVAVEEAPPAPISTPALSGKAAKRAKAEADRLAAEKAEAQPPTQDEPVIDEPQP